jgi:metallo-beta-lactamase family protein
MKKSSSFSLSFFGAADEVTGSRHLLNYGAGQLLFDCGLFQGHRTEAIEKNRNFPFDLKTLSAVLLSHAHIDHSGGLPLLAKKGFTAHIHCTRPTADLLRIMLMDSAFLQEEDAKFFNKIHQSEGLTIEPLYSQPDAEAALKLVVPHDYNVPFTISPGVQAQFLNAGHVLGSAMVMVEISTPKGRRRILFTGDLGRQKSLLMNPPTIPPYVDYLLIESTYGARLHDPVDQSEETFRATIQRAKQTKGIILIPSFALERTQEIVFILDKLMREKKIQPLHLYVDSPMATEITRVFAKHLDSFGFSASFKESLKKYKDPFGLDSIRYVQSVDESKRLNEMIGEKIIISASGMCEGGRILHHLRNNISKDSTQILLVGYQAQGTLGRRLAEGAKKVKIFGLEHRVVADVKMLLNFSSHADKTDLMWFIKGLSPRPKQVFLVHGDPEGKMALTTSLQQEGIDRVINPRFGETFEID